MARTSDPTLASRWQARLEAFAASDLSVQQFCQSMQCSVPTFYYWKRKLARATDNDTVWPQRPPGSTPDQARSSSPTKSPPATSAFIPVVFRR
jgi:hypothetical protein